MNLTQGKCVGRSTGTISDRHGARQRGSVLGSSESLFPDWESDESRSVVYPELELEERLSRRPDEPVG